MATIEFYYTLLSPYTYLVGDRLEKIAARHNAEIAYKIADFTTIFPQTGGLPVPKRHPARQAYRLQELRRLSEWSGLPFNIHPKHWPVDGTLAIQSVIAAAAQGADIGVLSRAYLTACWAEDRDISDPATVDAILTENGVDPASVAPAREAAQSTYEANTARALERGVFGAPSFVIGDEIFWGQDRLDFVERHLEKISA